jgi:hypothetical protein
MSQVTEADVARFLLADRSMLKRLATQAGLIGDQHEIPEGCTPADARKLREANHRLAEENHGLRVDEERYRWLRQQPNDTRAPRIDVTHWNAIDESANEGTGLRMESLDEAIDAARVEGSRTPVPKDRTRGASQNQE